MQINHGIHLAYCTNIHRGENWEETFAGLQNTLRVKQQVAPLERFAIGLRLSHLAASELSDQTTMSSFRKWLDNNNCYVFTINGFPYGRFHGGKVKEDVYRPDWTTTERLEYTCLLFDILSILIGQGAEGSISTCPGSFKAFGCTSEDEQQMHRHLHSCMLHMRKLAEAYDQDLHLGLEPEPLCYFETSTETVGFLNRIAESYPEQEILLKKHIGVNYDTCHLAVQYEEATDALNNIAKDGWRISKLHLSSALKIQPNEASRKRLRDFTDDIYLHQVVIRHKNTSDSKQTLTRVVDLPEALDRAGNDPEFVGDEWRIHFHIPLHHEPRDKMESTRDHLCDALDHLAQTPSLCRHLEMETYTWEVLPPSMQHDDVVDQLVREYQWCLPELRRRGLANG